LIAERVAADAIDAEGRDALAAGHAAGAVGLRRPRRCRGPSVRRRLTDRRRSGGGSGARGGGRVGRRGRRRGRRRRGGGAGGRGGGGHRGCGRRGRRRGAADAIESADAGAVGDERSRHQGAGGGVGLDARLGRGGRGRARSLGEGERAAAGGWAVLARAQRLVHDFQIARIGSELVDRDAGDHARGESDGGLRTGEVAQAVGLCRSRLSLALAAHPRPAFAGVAGVVGDAIEVGRAERVADGVTARGSGEVGAGGDGGGTGASLVRGDERGQEQGQRDTSR